MSDPYERVKGGRLTFKGGTLATVKSIDKKKKKKKSKKNLTDEAQASEVPNDGSVVDKDNGENAGEVFTIDPAKRLKYDQLFPVEAKKFGYDPKSVSKSVEDALDDRVKKKADRYCK
ncbi:uncharacterized protein LOC122081917 [Macadamia integrifolia]|uniref:uncharacterized protein LOC122081917 n=1 Tax=Macadamia integrifolia TaxID=60698 RepID=UPI001C4E47C4|nr:uncharacterized protein LOC122081917 [Macadamia integrifolia]XP_042505268.1 uncharacterized protein LOC122081917 [Macadamia integrifolia]XP_042505278.1 uncharacterized protein LOC122081917 [Macadamia integrifolia]XP_042505286.1 uncharacterized protein LOC122081917 [Macadamia integrifolia]